MRRHRRAERTSRTQEQPTRSDGTPAEPGRWTRVSRELKRHRVSYLFLGLSLGLLLGAVAILSSERVIDHRYESLVVAIGSDPHPQVAQRIFASPDLAREALDETGIGLAPSEVTDALELRLEPGSNIAVVAAVDSDSERAEDLANAAAKALVQELQNEGFFARALEATPVPSALGGVSLLPVIPSLALSGLLVVITAWLRARRESVFPEEPVEEDAETAGFDQRQPEAPAKAYETDALHPDRIATESGGLHEKLRDAAMLQRTLRDGASAQRSRSIEHHHATIETMRGRSPRSPKGETEDISPNRLTADEAERGSRPASSRQQARAPAETPTAERMEDPRDGSRKSAPDGLQSRLRIAMLLEKSFGDSTERERRGQLSLDYETTSPNEEYDVPTSELVDRISGIGNIYGARLASNGITTCAQLAECGPTLIARIAQTLPSNAVDWIDQARQVVDRSKGASPTSRGAERGD